ncbi:MAG: glycosyltransferase [Candidatus Paceibacterota bacterium]
MTRTRIKILHVLPYLREGGVEKRRAFLAEHLDTTRFEQRIVCFEASAGMKRVFARAGVEVKEIGPPSRWPVVLDLSAIYSVWKEIRLYRPAIVHAAVFEGMYLGGMAHICRYVLERIAGHRQVLLLEETSDLYNHPRSYAMRCVLRTIGLFANGYVAISPPVREYLVAEQKIPEHKAVMVLNAVPVPRTRTRRQNDAERKRLGIPPDAFVVGSVGRLDNAHKRFTDVIDAFERVARLSPRAWLLIVGDGPDRALLERHARQRGVADRTVFAGYVEQVDPLYGAMDVFVLASAHEGFGLVIAEAMMHALPVVATNVGGVPSLIRGGETGVLVGVGDSHAIASAIGELRVLPEIRRQIGTRARTFARRELSLKRYIRDVADLYEQTLAPTV